MARENKSRYVILGFLAHQPLSGYDIKKQMEMSISNFYDLSYGQIYPELAKLEKEGLVTGTVETSETRPDRKLYTITAEGRRILKEWLSAAVEEEKVRYDILLKLYFGSQISVEENIRNIQTFKERSIEKIKLFRLFEQNLRAVMGESQDHMYYLQTVLFGIQVYQAYVSWAEQAVIDLQDHAARK